MTARYVRSGAGGSNNGTSWANAYTSLAAAIAGSLVAGDDLWVADDHNETTAASVSLVFPGTAAAPNRIIAVNHSGSVPPVAADITTPGTQAQVSTTGASDLTISGHVYVYNLKFTAGSGANACTLVFGDSSDYDLVMTNCAFKKGNTNSSGASVQIGSGTNNPCSIKWNNCTLEFSGNQQLRPIAVNWEWKGGSVLGTAPSVLFGGSGQHSRCLFEGVDLNNLVGSTVLVDVQASDMWIHFKDCKLNASLAGILNAPTSPGMTTVLLTRSGSSGNFRVEKHDYMADLTTETTIYHTGGASDGTTPIAWKITPSGNAKWFRPFECPPIALWNDVITGNITLTMFGGFSAGLPNNDDVWFDVECLDTAGNPLGGFHTTTKATALATNAANPSDSSAWNSSPGTKFSMAVTIPAPAQKGVIYIYPKCAAVAGTMYLDPKVIQS